MSQSIPTSPVPKLENVRVAIVSAEWNGHITGSLTGSAVKTLEDNGLTSDDIDLYQVPGAIELTYGASQVIESETVDAVIVVGCVVRGGTPTSIMCARASPRVLPRSMPTVIYR